MRPPRSAALLLVAVALSSCAAHGRSPDELRRTPLGRVPTPAGSALAYEIYTPPEWNIDGVICPALCRTYASNDADAFQRAVVRAARDGGATTLRAPGRPEFMDNFPGFAGSLSGSVGGSSFDVIFHDLDDPAFHAPPWIDARAWRFVIELRIFDSRPEDGGRCYQ